MLGCLFGTLCVLALGAMLFGRRWRRGACGGHGGHRFGGWDDDWDGPGGFRGGPGRGGPGAFLRRGFLRRVFQRIDATPGQERVIAQAPDEVIEAGRAARDNLKQSRKEVAEAFAGPAFDESLLGDVYARQDDAIRSMRLAVTGALARVHEALEPEQRERLAALLTRRGGW